MLEPISVIFASTLVVHEARVQATSIEFMRTTMTAFVAVITVLAFHLMLHRSQNAHHCTTLILEALTPLTTSILEVT